MPILSPSERPFLEVISKLGYCNPFLPERLHWERAALGDDFREGEPVWSQPIDDPDTPRVNVVRIAERLERVIAQLRPRLRDASSASEAELLLYEDGVLLLLFQRYHPLILDAGFGPASRAASRWHFYREFLADWRHFFSIPGVHFPSGHDPRHTFACFRQIQRAFEQVFRDIIGASMPAARLRASIWQSIFTHDMRRYRRTLYARMGEFSTLITGPSGTGKELVARAIAQSGYVPFDDQRLTFADDPAGSFFPINISALSPTLVESELFGHRRGAFTGAVGDRQGWLETCPASGSVFLDELGDLDPAIQVKLLRVIETRTFHPVGDTAGRQFHGKLIAATHRDLSALIQQGKFREDLYYRLCSDQIVTPPLAEQLADSSTVLRDLVFYMSRRVAGAEGDTLAVEVMDWIEANLGPRYPWPGNYRELEQCVKNMLIRRNFARPAVQPQGSPVEEFARSAAAGDLTADELLTRYVSIVYSRTRSYEETARRLGMDRRTVKAKVDLEFLAKL